MRWSKPVNGLSLGIEVPPSPLRFVTTRDWKGPTIVYTELESGYMSVTGNPGGVWDESALVTVFLRNETDQSIYWSRSFEVWSLTLTAPDLEQPTPWPGSIPHLPPAPPIPLAPGAVDSVSLHVQRGLSIWPKISSGRYGVHVTYAPTHLLRYGYSGVERGSWVHPFDVPGFWTGMITTPSIAVHIDAEPHALSGKQQVAGPS